jgi:hypothetical protein
MGGVIGGEINPGAGGVDFVLSQHQVPSAPGEQPAAPPDASYLASSGDLMPTKYYLQQQGQDSIYSVGPNDPNTPPPGLLEFLRGSHGMWHTVMGKLDEGQLGDPLPGTAPPPGTNLPVGTNW